MMEARKVQKVGYSTLIVSLPKDWVEQVSLKQGDIVTFRRESDGGITVYPGLTRERENFRYVINADICDAPNLLTRIITANYLTGHDTIQIIAKKELSQRHLEEVRAVSRRLTGLGIVEQSLKSVTLQSFVDPTKFPIYGLMRRLQIILSSMLETAVKAVVEGRPHLADDHTPVASRGLGPTGSERGRYRRADARCWQQGYREESGADGRSRLSYCSGGVAVEG